jgi:hypothetical protein
MGRPLFVLCNADIRNANHFPKSATLVPCPQATLPTKGSAFSDATYMGNYHGN